jgi:hypothetical protein
MVQSIQTGASALFNTTASFLGTAKVSVGETQKTSQAAAQEEDATVTTSVQGDTLTISDAGAFAAKTFTAQSAGSAVSTDEGYTDKTAQIISSAASDAGITEYSAVKNENSADAAAVSGSSSDTSTDSNLSEYSLAELKEMLENGEITQAEYDAEIQSRQASATASDEQEVTASVTGAEE